LADYNDPHTRPLLGVPFFSKLNLATAGLSTIAGYPPYLNKPPAEASAAVVQRLIDAEAILLGVGTLSKLANDWICWSPVHGHTNNPWDLRRTTGGSL
jgi:amidase